MKHPAKYTNAFLPLFAKILGDSKKVLDPMAGTGKLVAIKKHGYTGEVFCNDILDWGDTKVEGVDGWTFGDAAELPYPDATFDALCTSPTYGNRMADHFNAKDTSKRITYRHGYGSPLCEDNTGRMQWGMKYKEKHNKIYKECIRVLKNDGIFIINVSDHIRAGMVIPVTEWHKETVQGLGMVLVENKQVKTSRMGFGANSKARVEHENIMVFKKENKK